MVYKRGDIVVVDFNPQKRSKEIAKVRPAVIMSDSDLNEILDLVSVVALTTNLIDDALPLRIRIKARGDLRQDSDAMVEQLRSIDRTRIKDKLASITSKEMRLVENGVIAMLGLDRSGQE